MTVSALQQLHTIGFYLAESGRETHQTCFNKRLLMMWRTEVCVLSLRRLSLFPSDALGCVSCHLSPPDGVTVCSSWCRTVCVLSEQSTWVLVFIDTPSLLEASLMFLLSSIGPTSTSNVRGRIALHTTRMTRS